jgi:putrescine aminotransferase
MHAMDGGVLPRKSSPSSSIDQPWYLHGEAEGNLTPRRLRAEGGRAQQLEAKILELGADTVAAFIAEPVQGAGGVIDPPATYWPEIQRICRKTYDILLVADEVIGGFGRTAANGSAASAPSASTPDHDARWPRA